MSNHLKGIGEEKANSIPFMDISKYITFLTQCGCMISVSIDF